MRNDAYPGLTKSGFTFKQFQILHDKCGMKVSTDGILLGGYVTLPNCGTVLDIGSGSGLLSLMLAQRLSLAGIVPLIQAVEIDQAAVQQSQQNIHASPWPLAVKVEHADFLSWQLTQSQRFGGIVCNPPYWQAGHACRNEARSIARYTTTMRHDKLLAAAKCCLKPDGFFSLILPVLAAETVCLIAQQTGWYIAEYIQVCEQKLRDPHRILLKLALSPQTRNEAVIVIRDAPGQYSDAFRYLTNAFYLFR